MQLEEKDESTSGHKKSNGMTINEEEEEESKPEQQTTATTTSNRTTEQQVNRPTGQRSNEATGQHQPNGSNETTTRTTKTEESTRQSSQRRSISSNSQPNIDRRSAEGQGHLRQMMNGEPAPSDSEQFPENVDLIRVHCVIERLKNEELTSPEAAEKRDLVMDVETVLPGSVPLRDLVKTVLIRNRFHWIDVIGAQGYLLPSRYWQPISMETVTRNRLATIRDVIRGLEKTLILLIVLQKNFSNELRLKDLFLKNLLSLIPNEVFESLKCPLDKNLLESLRRAEPIRDITEDLLDSLDNWCRRSDDVTAFALRSGNDLQNSKDFDLEADDRSSGNDSQKRQNGTSGGREGPDSISSSEKPNDLFEFSLLENWRRKNPHPSLTELTGYLEELNRRRLVSSEPVLTLDQLAERFLKARTSSDPSNRSLDSSVLRKSQSNFDGSFSNCDRKRKRFDSEVEVDMELESNGVPFLPNRNAVYVVQPLPLDTGELENVEVVRPPSETERPPSSYSTGSSGREESPKEPFNCVSGNKGSDENHNNCSMIPLTDEATDLRLTNRRKMAPNKLPSDWNPESARSQHPSLWPVRKFEKNSAADYDLLSDSPSSKSTSEAVQSLHCSLPASFLYPHYPVARISPLAPLPPNALQLAAMSQLFHQSAAAFYHSSQSIFPSSAAAGSAGVGHERDDHSSSPGSNQGDSERRKRSRVFIDPNTEIPRLELWYGQDTHPSALQIEQYTNELNSAEYRQRFPKLETKNVQLWFKNHRAKVKRLTSDDDSIDLKVIPPEDSFPRKSNAFST